MIKKSMMICKAVVFIFGISDSVVVMGMDPYKSAIALSSKIVENGDDCNVAEILEEVLPKERGFSKEQSLYALTVVERNLPDAYSTAISCIASLKAKITKTTDIVDLCRQIFEGQKNPIGKITSPDGDTLAYMFRVLAAQKNGTKEKANTLKVEIESCLTNSGIDPKQYE